MIKKTKMFKRKWWILIPLLLIILYLLGPRPSTPVYKKDLPQVPADLQQLESYIRLKESAHKLKPDNEARIVWANDSAKAKTEYAILYLHGFSASQAEGDPVHRTIAREFGCNLYLSRLAAHGLDTTEQLLNLTAENYWESAREAYAIASQLGNKVIIMGTSTGGTLALMLAAAYPETNSLVLMSPNIAIFDGTAWVLNDPWGLQIARLVTGSKYIYSEDTRPLVKKYWSYGYRIEAVVQLEELLETAMNPELFHEVKQPTLMLYYYKDDVHKDSVVQIEPMKKMFSELGTPPDKKRAVAMPNPGNHVIGSYIKSHDVEGVTREIEKFMQDVLGLRPKD
jgi:esterase/lipase